MTMVATSLLATARSSDRLHLWRICVLCLRKIMLTLAWMLALPGFAQTEALLVKRVAELRQGPSTSATLIASLPAQSSVTRLPERQGPWMHVKTDAGLIGWIHMFDVASAATQSSTGSTASGALRGLAGLFGQSNTNNSSASAISTVGIRGMSAEDIANAQPNLASVKQVEAQRADAAQAKRFADDAQLSAQRVDALPTPAAPASSHPETDAAGSTIRGVGK